MTSQSPPAPLAGNFVQSHVSANIIKFLDYEFDKFEEKAKNCDRYTVIDLRLPVRIIELFWRLLKLCAENPVLQQNIDSFELFKKISLLMRAHFKTNCTSGLEPDLEDEDSDGSDDYDWDERCETDSFKRFFHYFSQQVAKGNIKKLLRDVKHANDWLLEQNGVIICEMCNCKLASVVDISAHAQQANHEKNFEIFKSNELYVAFPDSHNETFGCKICRLEYSTFSSLVKHFDKPQHKDTVKNYSETDTKSDSAKTSAETSSGTQDKTDVKKSSNTDNKSEGKKVQVVINSMAKNTGSVAPKAELKSSANIPTQTQSANTSCIVTKSETKTVTIIPSKPETKTTSAQPKADTKSSANKPQAKNTTKVAPKPPAKNISSIATKAEAKNTTNATPANGTKSSVNISSKSEVDTSAKIDASKSTYTGSALADKNSTSTSKSQSKSSTSKLEYNSKFIVSKNSSDKYCQICDRNLPDVGSILAHVKGPNHLKMISTFDSNQEYIKMSSSGEEFYCMLCGTRCPNIHKLACHFREENHTIKAPSALPPAAPTPKPVLKTTVKNMLNTVQLNDTDKKFLKQKTNVIQCIVCGVTLSVIDEVADHINSKPHSQNVLDFIKHEKYVQLPSDKVTSFNCLKCTSVFDSLAAILLHCKDHIDPQAKPVKLTVEPFKLKKTDEKFISKGKTDKNLRCNLCDKELPTEAAVNSHTGSSNHVKNYNMFAKNETYCVGGKTSCSLCEHNCHDLASLVKHFKSDTHQKTVIKGKKPQSHTSIHIPSYAKPKLDDVTISLTPTKSPKSVTPTKKVASSPRKSRLQLFPLSEANLDQLNVCGEQFPMKKPDNSYIVAINDIFYCRICDADLPAVTAAAHMNGATHRINVEVFEYLQCHVLSTPDSVKCTFCNLTFDHVHKLVKHFRDKLHVKPASLSQKNITQPSDYAPVCESNSIENKLIEKPAPEQISNSVENKDTEKSIVSLKHVKIPKHDRKHIFRLNETIVQCNLCNTKLLDNDALESHINNLNHKRNSNLYQENEPLIKQLDSLGSEFQCISCYFIGDLNKVIKHCKKKQHLTAKSCEENISDDDDVHDENTDQVDTTISEFDLKCISMKNGIVRCNICHSKLTGEKNLLEHMNSVHHKKSAIVYKLNEPFIEQFDELGYSYKCIVCEVIFTRLDTMIRHFAEEGHVQITQENEAQLLLINNKIRFNVKTYDFECILCSLTFRGFADLTKHCYSAQHEIFKKVIQSEKNEIPLNITIIDYQYHCNACNVRLLNKALMEKHQNKRIHKESATFYEENPTGDQCPNVIEIIGYEYLCNLCWLPMYSASELASHEKTNMHKNGKNFDNVWRFNEKYLIMCENMYKVRCKLCEKTIGIEKFIMHCTSREHRMKFIASYLEESVQDQHIVWRNGSQYCTLCDCKLINNHNLVNHVNSEKHKLKLLQQE